MMLIFLQEFWPCAVYNLKIKFCGCSCIRCSGKPFLLRSLMPFSLPILSCFIYFLSLSKDPKGDGSWMFPVRLSACFQKRVWQESSECFYFVILLFSLQSNFPKPWYLILCNFF